MAWRDAFVLGGASLDDFIKEFRQDVDSFLASLRSAQAVTTGKPVLLFAAGLWNRRYQVSPGALVLDILYTKTESREGLQHFWERAGYKRWRTATCHHPMGEWKGFPRDRVICMSRGHFVQRAVHLVQVPRGAVETVLSRVFGSASGTYLTGGGRLVCLFPLSVLEQRRCWVPARFTHEARAQVTFKYRPWRVVEGSEATLDVTAVGRTVSDSITWSVHFDAHDGSLLPEQEGCDSATR